MELFQKNKQNQDVIGFAHINKVIVDQDKINSCHKDLTLGIENYCLFQSYVTFKWPAWLHNSSVIDSAEYRPLSPPFMFNNSLRDGISFSNSISRSELFIDPSGMITPSYDGWSIELWISEGGKIFRASEDLTSVIIQRNHENSIVSTRWTTKQFEVKQEIIGARTIIDEAIVKVSVDLKKKGKKNAFYIVLRPYNTLRLGTVSSAAYNPDGTVTVNGNKRLALADKPDFVFPGNAGSGDINIAGDENSEVSCGSSLAALAFGYRINTGNNNFVFHISLDEAREIQPARVNYSEAYQDFSASIKAKREKGFNIQVNDSLLKHWFYGSKVTLLNIINDDIYYPSDRSKNIDFRTSFFLIMGLNKMGYGERADELMELLFSKINYKIKDVTFNEIINICYLICSFNELYLHKRDMGFLQDKYAIIKNLASLLLKYSKSISSLEDIGLNSMEMNFSRKGHSYDLILIAAALWDFSYLSRSMGIFGEEITFQKESAKIKDIFTQSILKEDNDAAHIDDFYCYNAASIFPFSLKKIGSETTDRIYKSIISHYGDLPIKINSLGWDMVSTFIFFNVLIYMKDPHIWHHVSMLKKIGDKKLVLSEYINPHTYRGCWGKGASKLLSALVFATMKNLIYIDLPERLEIFPVPRQEWFKTGSEIIIENGPSRFGNISLKTITTSNEIHIHFEELPKYVPPDILINLPFKARIIKDDDFIVKKESSTSFLLNGWPSKVRFIKK